MRTKDSDQRSNPRVSVIIPTYNRANIIKRAITSVLSQSYQNFEIIVVDDGSTDNTAEIVKNMEDKRIIYLQHPVNKGTPAAARNTGILESRGDLIGFVDSDDEWLPEKLHKQVDKFDSVSDKVGLIYGGFTVNNEDTEQIIAHVYPQKRGNLLKEMLKMSGPPWSSLTTLIRKECIQEIGLFDENLRIGEDRDMFVRIAQRYEFDFVPEIVAKLYRASHGLTADRLRVFEAQSKFIDKYNSYLSENPAILAHILKYIGHRYLVEFNDLNTGRRYLKEAVKANPRGIIPLAFHLLAIYLVPSLYKAILKSKIMLYFRGSGYRLRKLLRF
jgi:glycosyltransferase involved in cell wall biosynthesis